MNECGFIEIDQEIDWFNFMWMLNGPAQPILPDQDPDAKRKPKRKQLYNDKFKEKWILIKNKKLSNRHRYR